MSQTSGADVRMLPRAHAQSSGWLVRLSVPCAFVFSLAASWWIGRSLDRTQTSLGIIALSGSLLLAGSVALRRWRRTAGDERFRLLVDGVEDLAICMLDPQGNFISWSRAAQRIHGFGESEVIGGHFSRFYTAQDLANDAPQRDLRVAAENGRVKMEDWRLRRDGSCFWAEIIITALRDSKGTLRGFCKVIRDISDRKQSELLEGDRRQVLEMVVQNKPLTGVLDRFIRMIERQYPDCVASIVLFTGEGQKRMLAPNLPESIQPLVTDHLVRILEKQSSNTAVREEVVIVGDIANDNEWQSLHELSDAHSLRTCLVVPIFSGAGKLLGSLATFYLDTHHPDRTELELLQTVARLAAIAIEHRQLTDQLAYQAQHDPLTGLPNRVLLDDRLQQALAQSRRNHKQVALFFIDLDRFKVINDTLGHEAGDILLCQVTQRLRETIRETDTLVRMGGDEFTLVLPELNDRQDAVKIAQKLLEVMKTQFDIAGHELFVSASIGIAVYPQDGRNPAELSKNADTAMYRAKRMGRNAIECFAPEMNAAAMEKLDMEGQLRRALTQNELILHFQPQVDRDGTVVSLEALLRWVHPRLGMVPPVKFIPLAEETGLIVPMGQWVLQEACHQCQAWHRMGFKRLKIAVNVSALQFAQTQFVQTVMEALLTSELDAKWLELELTESLLMHDTKNATRKLNEIRALGVGIAIDDFGTGYSSLAYLQRLPIDTLKIDRAFVNEITAEEKDVTLVKAITSLAHSLNLKVVAEGVETDEQRLFLLQIGCDGMQGYFFGKPQSHEGIPALMSKVRMLALPA